MARYKQTKKDNSSMIIFKTIGILFLVLLLNSCKGQTTKNENVLLGGPCEDCEAALDYKLLNLNLKPVDSLPEYSITNPKLKISGTVFKLDGETPAENVILYIYHTNRYGIYAPSKNPIGWENRHGEYRGWLKTDKDGKYTFFTFRPAPYPQLQESEHIHMYVKEPNKTPYYIDNYMFMDDPILKKADNKYQKKRGGSGLINLTEQNGILMGSRDIILGLNIPNYNE